MTHVTVDSPDYENYDFVIKTTATQPNIVAVLKEDDGTAVDLTGATVNFKMKRPGADSTTIDDGVIVTDAENGVVTYQWKDGDTDTADTYNAEFAVDYSGGSPVEPDEFFPSDEYLHVNIIESL